MSSAGSAPVEYAQTVARLLYPPPAAAEITWRSGGTAVAEWLLLPDPRRPTLMVPTGVPGASRMLARHGDHPVRRATRAGLGWGVRVGVLPHLPYPRLRVASPGGVVPPGSLAERLTELVPEMTACGVLLGTARANRKPVLQLFDGAGESCAFVKVGVDDLTRALVRSEASNLSQVTQARLRLVRAPDVLHAGTHDSLELLVLSVLGTSQRKRDQTVPLAAMGELASAFGTHSARLADSPCWSRLRAAQQLLPTSPSRDLVGQVMDAVEARWGAEPVEFGAWHGDWAPWNMGRDGDVVELWDWERLDTDVPLGFDVVHFRAQTVRHDRSGLPDAERHLRDELPALLEGALGDRAPVDVDCVLALYGLEVAVRYLAMTLASERGARSHPRAEWLLGLAGRLAAAGH